MAITSEIIGRLGGAGVEIIPVEGETYGGDSAHLTTINTENESTLIVLDGRIDYKGTQGKFFPNISTNLREEEQATGDVTYVWITSESLTLTLVNNSSRSAANFAGHVYAAKI